ncbi:MAG: Ig-like domain-containing protein [Bacteroidota bacterium]
MVPSTNVYSSQILWIAIRRVSVYLSLGLLLHACARPVTPTGGPKDETPPKLLKTYPHQEETDFKGKTIKLVFDKEIDVRDIYNKLVVTPRLKKLEGKPSYTYKVRGNTLILTLEAPLDQEATYTFNLNDAVRDITEGNVAEAPTLTFSTGEQIDTMYVTGQVKDHMTHELVDKVTVALYKAENDTIDCLENPPDYFIKTDEKGKFKLAHIQKGNYYLCASTHKEAGQVMIDPGVDTYGFLREPIDLTTAPLEGVTLSILKADIREFKLQSKQPQDQYFELSFNKPVESYTLGLVRKTKRFKEDPILYSHLVEDKQVIKVYNTFGLLEEDSLEVQVTAQDVLGTVIEETFDLRFREGNIKKYRPSYEFEPTSGTAIKPEFMGTMTLNKPVKEVLADRLYFVFNGQKTVSLSAQDLQFNEQRDVVTIKKQLNPQWLKPSKNNSKEDKENEGLVLHIEEEAFVTIEKDTNKAMRYVYTFQNPEAYGTIKGTVTTQAPGFIVQLLDTDYKVVDEIKNKRHYQFKEVVPGNYKLRVLALQKADAAWSFGNIKERIEPDPVLFHTEEVAVVANWEITGIDFSF